MLIATCGRIVEAWRVSACRTTTQRAPARASARPLRSRRRRRSSQMSGPRHSLPAAPTTGCSRQTCPRRSGSAHDGFTPYQVHLLGVVLASTIEAWRDILNKKRTSSSELSDALGMEPIQYVRMQRAMQGAVPSSSSLMRLSTGNLTGSRGGSDLATRDSPAKHISVTYFPSTRPPGSRGGA